MDALPEVAERHGVAASALRPGRITATELAVFRERGVPVTVLDVRHREAWTVDPARISGAIWLPLEEVPHRRSPRGVAEPR